MSEIDGRLLKIIGKRFGYSKSELDVFKNDERNIELVNRVKEFQNVLFVLEVVESKGCMEFPRNYRQAIMQ